MGLLDMQMQGATQPQVGLLGTMQPQGAVPAMPPEMMQMVEKMKGAPPDQKQQFLQQVIGQIQGSGKDPAMIKQVLAAFLQAMQ